MTALYVIAGILLVLWLISLIRVGGIAEYSAEGFLLLLRLGPFRLELLPGKPKEEKPVSPKKEKKPKKKKEKKTPEKEPVPLTEKVGGTLSLVRELLPPVAEAAGTLLRKIRVDELVLHLTWAARDPASAAMGFGAAQAALGGLWPLLERGFNIRERDVGVAVSFDRTEPIVYVRGSLSLTIGQCVAFGAVYGVKALIAYLHIRRSRPPKKTETAKQ